MKTRIAILGIGGVGGFIGGKLAAQFTNSETTEIIFIARGKHAEVISKNGLALTTPHETQVVFPDLVSNDPDEIGKVDVLILCTKSYDLIDSLQRLQLCIHEQTILLPFLNGVNHSEEIRSVFPNARIARGCIYIVASIVDAGKVIVTSGLRKVLFGGDEELFDSLKPLEKLFQEAGIGAELHSDIDEVMWKKFAFISPMASATCAFNLTIRAIHENERCMEKLKQMTEEVVRLAAAKGINLPADIFQNTENVMKSLPLESTSSMHRDLRQGRPIEIEALTRYVISSGKEFGIDTPAFEWAYKEIMKRFDSLHEK